MAGGIQHEAATLGFPTTKTGFTAPGYDVDSHYCWYKKSVWSLRNHSLFELVNAERLSDLIVSLLPRVLRQCALASLGQRSRVESLNISIRNGQVPGVEKSHVAQFSKKSIRPLHWVVIYGQHGNEEVVPRWSYRHQIMAPQNTQMRSACSGLYALSLFLAQ